MLGSEQHGLNAANGLNAIDSIVRQTAGNKDTIKRLIQTGVISEMQGVLAGMRADEISKAGMLNKGNMPTVAQQVLSPQPPQSMAPPAPPQMGVPSAPPPMPPQAPQDMQAPQGMADGGLAALPVPDDMFNSAVGDSDTQQYAPGGIVAFANGGGASEDSPLGPWFAEQVKTMFPGATITSMGRTAEHNRKVGGVKNSYHLTNNAIDVVPPKGMSLTEFGTALKQHFGPGIDTIFNSKGHFDHVHLEPGGKYSAATTGPMARQTGDNPTAVPDIASIADNFELFQNLLGKRDTKARDALLASVNISPEQEKKDKDRDLGYALLAASQAFSRPGPFLSNVTGALGAMAEPLQEGEKSRKAEKLAGLKAAAEAENEDYQDRRSLLSPAAALYAEQMRGREAALGRKQHGEEFSAELQTRRDIAAAELQNRIDTAKIKLNPSDFDTMLEIQLHGTPEQKAAMDAALKAKAQAQAQAQLGMIPGAVDGQAGVPGAGVVDFSSLK
jgi:hypothetical protein